MYERLMAGVVTFNQNEDCFMNKDDVYKFLLKLYLSLKYYNKVLKKYTNVI